MTLDKSSVTGLVDRAERRGLVARVPSPADRRAVLVRLTDEGRSLVSAAAGLFAADVTAMLGHLAARDRAALARLVSRLLVAHAAGQGIDLFATVDPPASDLRGRRTRRSCAVCCYSAFRRACPPGPRCLAIPASSRTTIPVEAKSAWS